MRYTAGQAAKATGKSIPTITRAINNGKISAEKTPEGGYLIDPAELHRVFPPLSVTANDTPAMLGSETPLSENALQVEIRMLRERLEGMSAEKNAVIEDLRRRLDAEAEERRRLTLILTDQSVPKPVERAPWWKFGRGAG